MSEPRTQSKYVPVRFRIRPSTEQASVERDSTTTAPQAAQIHVPNLRNVSELQRRTQQTKELLRLNNLLRADLGLNEVLQQFAASICACTGFRVLIINLIEDSSNYVTAVAVTGTSEEGKRFFKDNPINIEQMQRLMQQEFSIGQSYFIPRVRNAMLADLPGFTDKQENDYEPGGWHPESALIVPLFSPREQKLLGFLSLDDPEDGKIPTLESIEVVELFANQTAIAIDNARLFQERETQRLELEHGIAMLQEDMEQLQRGDLRVRMRPSHPSLQPIVVITNTTIEEISTLLSNVQMVTHAVEEHMRSVQLNSKFLVRDINQQERQVQQISDVTNEIADMIHHVAERADDLSKRASEAMEVTQVGQNAVDRSIEGMSKVREATMQSARTMKRMGESGQEINETVLAITDLTTRMHLLALNAAIEAARAGEQGQGFAVVAQEIRTLAVNSAEAARKLGVYIRTIQLETTTVSQSIEQNTQQVVIQTELANQVGVALDAISIVTERMAHLIQGICAMTDNQEHGSERVVHAVGEILRMSSEITQHTHETQQSLTHLVELTDVLRSRMAVFRI